MNTNKEVVSELYELLNTRQLDQLDRIVDSNCEGPNGEKGAEGFEHTVAPIIAAFPDIHWTLEDLIAEGDRVVVRWEWVGTFKAAFRGVPPTGKRMTNHAIGIYQLRDGKILRSWLETDRLGFLQQLGVVPENVSPGVAPKPAPVQN
ncbi:ester cyclase [Dinghuibacter silviterrae]|nr:ester cyclase [Dinghuibacter silviterrae]